MPLTLLSIRIIQVTEVTDELVRACQRLTPQLTHINPPPSRAQLSSILAERTLILFLAQDQETGNEEIVGMATLVLYHVLTGMRAMIEDVVVDEKARGSGVGEALTRACLERAEQAGCQQTMLTSNPSREAANRLYQRMGFELRKTNVYKYSFKRG
jgi:ribosomal protein S18 acetylase RimI-like enzyme